MANLRDLSHKITSLRNMQKVMRAMNMIATIKLRKMVSLQGPLNLFDTAVNSISRRIVQALADTSHPAVKGWDRITKVHLIMFTADKGLCGSHNTTVHRAADEIAKECRDESRDFDVTCIGLKGANYCRRKGYTIYHQTEIVDKTFGLPELSEIASKITGRFLSGEVQRVILVYNNFVSTIHQTTVSAEVLPLIAGQASGDLNTVLEPNPIQFIVSAAALCLLYRLEIALNNSYLSEHASRMTAMENATNNSEDLISRYVTLENRARQTSITNEIIEIISGKEALKG